MKHLSTLTPTDMRNINRTAVLELLREKGPISKSYISEELGISLPSILRITDGLITEKLVRETGGSEWSGGRPRTLIEFNTTEQLTVGIDLGGTKVYGAVTDLGGSILFDKTIHRHNSIGEESYEIVVDLIKELIDYANKTGKDLRGIGIGVPGVTEHKTGKVLHAPSLEWIDFSLKEKLEKEFGIPVVVDNDVNMAALGEMWFGHGQGISNLALMSIGTGIGMGLILNNTLYRGSHEAAGEIGYLIPSRKYLDNTYNTGFGALEYLAAGVGLVDQAKKALKGKRSPEELEEISGEDVCNAFRNGEEWSFKIIDNLVDYLSIAIIGTCAFFDPEVIVIGGGISRASDIFLDRVKKRLEGKLPAMLRLKISTLGTKASVLGATIKLLHDTSNFYIVQELS